MIVSQGSVVPFDFDGLAIRDYTAELDASSSFAVITVPAGAEHAEAWSRRSDKYYYVAEGEVEFTLAGEATVLAAGDFSLVAQGERFAYRNTSDRTATLCLFHTPSFDADAEVFV
jgi:mannose-6-phosphate isomerase-like protein (cupin superfamily)